MHTDPAPAHRRAIPGARLVLTAAVISLVVVGVFVARSDTDAAPDVLSDWHQWDIEPLAHRQDYDRVAFASGPDLGWLTWDTMSIDDVLAVRLWDMNRWDRPATRVRLGMPSDLSFVFARALDIAGDRWVAVATARSTPAGVNEHVVAWRGTAAYVQDPPPALLEFPDGTVPNRHAPVTARLAELSAVAIITGDSPAPDQQGYGPATGLSMWVADDDHTWENVAGPAVAPEAPLTSIELAADGQQFVLAAVDAQGTAHAWRSVDARSWTPLGQGVLPQGASTVSGMAVAGPDHIVASFTVDGFARLVEIREEDVSGAGELTGLPRHDTFTLGSAAVIDDELVIIGTQSSAPVISVRRDDEWVHTEDRALIARRAYRGAGIAERRDGAAILIVSSIHLDVERWIWRRPPS